jgi:hypothetical protein
MGMAPIWRGLRSETFVIGSMEHWAPGISKLMLHNPPCLCYQLLNFWEACTCKGTTPCIYEIQAPVVPLRSTICMRRLTSHTPFTLVILLTRVRARRELADSLPWGLSASGLSRLRGSLLQCQGTPKAFHNCWDQFITVWCSIYCA